MGKAKAVIKGKKDKWRYIENCVLPKRRHDETNSEAERFPILIEETPNYGAKKKKSRKDEKNNLKLYRDTTDGWVREKRVSKHYMSV